MKASHHTRIDRWQKCVLPVFCCTILSACSTLEHESKSQSWEQCRTSAQNLLKKRQKKQALAMAKDSVAAAQTFGESDFRYGVAHCVLADMLVANEKNAEAKSAYKKSIKILNRAEKLASADLEAKSTARNNSNTRNNGEQEKLAESKVHLRLIREDLANSFDKLGEVYLAEGNFADAAKSFEKAAEKYEIVLDTDRISSNMPELVVHQQLVRCLLSLAQAAAANADSQLADKSFNRAILYAAASYCNESDRKEIRNEYLKYLQQSGRQTEATGLMADVLFDQLTADGTLSMYEGDFTAAEISYRKALEEAAKSVYSKQRILKALFNLTTVFVRAGKPDEVQKCSSLTDDFMRRNRNASRKEYDQIQEVLANYFLVSGNPFLSKQALLKQLQYKMARFGRYSREVCTIYALLGQVELATDSVKNKTQATQYANEALEIIKKQPLDRSYFDSMNKLAALMFGLDRYEDARDLNQKLIEMKSRKYEPGDPWLVSMKVNLVVLEQRFKHKERAEKIIKDVIKDVNASTPEQKAGNFPYVVLLLACCVQSQWWDAAEQVAKLGQSILHDTLSNAYPSDTARGSWTRDIETLEKKLNRKIS